MTEVLFVIAVMVACINFVGSASICPRCRSEHGRSQRNPIEHARREFLARAQVRQSALLPYVDDEDIKDGGSGDNQEHTNVESLLQFIKDFPFEKASCCRLGKLMGQLGYQCKSRRFSRANHQLKEKLIIRALEDIHVDDSGNVTQVLYQPFRRCVFKRPKDLDKCCYATTVESNGSPLSLIAKTRSPAANINQQNSMIQQRHRLPGYSHNRHAQSRFNIQRSRSGRRHGSQVSSRYDRWRSYRDLRSEIYPS